MAGEDIRKAGPYNDDYDPTKQYTHFLAVPGRVHQAREETSIQTMIFDYLKRVSDTLFKDGAITQGMGFSLSTDKVLTVEDGRVYLNGKLHYFKKQTLQITGVGTEKIGVILDETIVTEEQDVTLTDPAENMQNFGQAGMHRLKSVPKLTLNNSSAATIYELEDGQLKVEVSRPNFDGLSDTLAKRTYDESGNYRVNGLEIVAEPYDANNVQLTVEVGTAYIKGYQVIKPAPIKRVLPISTSTRSGTNEPKVFKTGTLDYELNNYPAKSITKVVSQVSVTETLTRGGTANGLDYPTKSPLVTIDSIVAGGTTYVKGTDFKQTGDAVDWSLGGAEPASGTSYTITYKYNKTMAKDVDYQLYSITGDWGETKDYVRFKAGGDRPVADSTFTVDYEYYLGRIDLVWLDRFGNVGFETGQPDIPRSVQPPFLQNADVLPLGSVYFPPNSGNAVAKFSSVTRLEMAELQRLAKRVTDVEYNQAITELDRQAIAGESASTLKGVFSDSFRNPNKGDLTHPLFTVMYSLEDGLIMLPPNSTNATKPSINTGASSAKVWGRLITAPMTEVVSINQFYATRSMQVNPYLAFNTLASMKLIPEVDNWIEDSFIEVNKTEFEARKFYRWWNHKLASDAWRYNANADLMDLIVEGTNGQKFSDWRGETASVVKTEKSREILEEAITNMRQIEVQISASNLLPSADNLIAYFDGIKVTLTPLAGFSAGSTAGSVRANASGEVKAKFTIPAGVRTGTREVVLSNANNTATAPFTSIGTRRTTINTITTTRITGTIVDPLAQSFEFPQDTVLTSVGAYFSAKDATKNVIVQIRNMVNGYPGQIVYGEKVLKPSQINISSTAATETKVTFDDPVMCAANEQYCMVFLTDSATPAMWVADLGGKDVTTGTVVANNPYLAGLLFSSANAKTWTAHQGQNLKFKVYTAEFQPTGTIEFDPLFDVSADRLLLLSDYLTPRNTGCVWEMSLDDKPYQPITSYEDVDLTTVASKVKLRATFKSDKNMSPLMALDSFTLVSFLSATSGSYIGRNTVMDTSYTTVVQTFEGSIPQGCTIVPQLSYDGGTTWKTPTSTGQTQVSADFTRYEYSYTVPNGTNATQFRARLNLTANSPVLRPKARKFINVIK